MRDPNPNPTPNPTPTPNLTLTLALTLTLTLTPTLTRCEKDLSGTLAFFDTNLDGKVTTAELTQVLQHCGFGLSTEQAEGLSSQLLQGQPSVKTTTLLDNFQVKFKESAESEQGPRPTPAWAKALLDTARPPRPEP